MCNVRELDITQEGYEEYQKIDVRTYTRRVFGMFGGERELLSLNLH